MSLHLSYGRNQVGLHVPGLPGTTVLQLFYGSLDCVWNNPGELVPKETFSPLTPVVVINHPLTASSIYYVHDICCVQFTCLTVFFAQFFSKFSLVYLLAWHPPLILHTFLHPVIVFFSQHLPIPSHLFCCSAEIMSSNPRISLNPLLGTLFCSLMPHIHLTILISAN